LHQDVKVLDPATGTGTFLASTIELIKTKIDKKYQILGVEKEQFIKEVSNHILHNFYAFEFMIAPYTVAHLKLTLLLKTLEFDFSMTANDGDSDNDRWKIYLSNTLDDPSKEPNSLFGFSYLSKEGRLAKNVKNQKDIIAIIGNPPYSGSSQNPHEYIKLISKGEEYINKYTPMIDKSNKLIGFQKELKKRTKNGFVIQKTWIGEQIEYYKYHGTKKLYEKNPKMIQDDYVKFIRFAQFQIDSAGFGAIGYIVPHGFLDNPTFRYMRKSLMSSFSKIYILDLHGNDNKKEKDEQGNKDENVFDIKQGVCIALFVKEQVIANTTVIANEVKQSTNGLPRPEGLAVTKTCEVYHGDLYGKREDKFHILQTKTFKELCTNKLNPSGEMSYFIPRSEDNEYEKFWSLKDIFKVCTSGVTTSNDELFIRNDENFIFDNSIKFDKSKIKDIVYKPFDIKKIYYDIKLLDRARYGTMQHFALNNIGLVFERIIKNVNPFDAIFITNNIADCHLTGSKSYVTPLYLYDENTTSFFEDEKNINFTENFMKFKNENLNSFGDEEIFYYIYGLLYSPTYRTIYNEFLKTDFPRIDFGYDIVKISKLGFELTQLHLLTHTIFDEQDKWNLKVEGKEYAISFAKKADIFRNNKIYLNPNTHISGVDEATFRFMIGGYQVLDKWLSDRKNTTLNINELLHYLKIIVSLRETQRVMKEIDEVVERRKR